MELLKKTAGVDPAKLENFRVIGIQLMDYDKKLTTLKMELNDETENRIVPRTWDSFEKKTILELFYKSLEYLGINGVITRLILLVNNHRVVVVEGS